MTDSYPYADGERREFEARYEVEDNQKKMIKHVSVMFVVTMIAYFTAKYLIG